MAKHRRKAKRIATPQLEQRLDATPERLAKGDHSEFINPAEIDPNEQPISRVRRFTVSHLKRLHNAGKFTWVQYYAGKQYADCYERTGIEQKITSSYEEPTSGGEISYGLPRTEAQRQARKDLAEMKEVWPQSIRDHMHRFLARDKYDKLSHRARDRDLALMRNALDRLAMYLRSKR